MGRRWVVLAAMPCLLSTAPRAGWAWGPVAHQAVTAQAIDTLPGAIKSFYKAHRLELPTLALEPTFAEEGADRRFAVDQLMPFPFVQLPRSEASLKERFGDAATQAGRLPWLIQESYARLVDAFRAREKDKILAESDVLAGLLTDIHNPLALSESWDGQKTGQNGLWVRFSSRFPEALQQRLKVEPDAARFLDEPKEFVFSMTLSTYIWLDNLLYEDDLARRARGGSDEIYYDFLALHAKPLLQDRLSRAAEDVGSYWYTAWTVAGRPSLK